MLSFINLFLGVLVVIKAATGLTCPEDGTISYKDNGRELSQVYNKLVGCPDVHTLSLRFGTNGCVINSEPYYFKFRGGDRFAPIRKLTLEAYDTENRFSGSVKEIHYALPSLVKVQKFLGSIIPALWPEPNLDQWILAQDFSKLETLKMDKNKYFWKRMPPLLQNLRDLEVSTTCVSPEFMAFLDRLPLLRSIRIHAFSLNQSECDETGSEGPEGFPWATIYRHGSTLRSLSIGTSESRIVDVHRQAAAPEEILRLYESCPHLEHVGLDLERNGSWPNATLNALVQHPQLTSLHLRLELGANLHLHEEGEYSWNPIGIGGNDSMREPRLSEEVAELLFKDLRSKKMGKALQFLQFEVGDWIEDEFLPPLYFPPWDEGRARRIYCEATVIEGSITETCEMDKRRDEHYEALFGDI